MRGEKAIGEASPSYLWSNAAPKEIYSKIPHAKVIISLRNPIERLFSHYLMDVRSGITQLTFLEAVKRDLKSSEKGWGISNLYIELGLYYEQVKRYISLFPQGQLLILLFDDLKENPEKEFTKILNFLEVDNKFKLDLSKKYNSAAFPRLIGLNNILNIFNLRPFTRSILPDFIKKIIKQILYTNKDIPELLKEDRRYLKEIYISDIEKLSALINKDLSSWLT